MDKLTRVMRALNRLRPDSNDSEYKMQMDIAVQLCTEGLFFNREINLKRGIRPDFLVEGGICVEVKKNLPNRSLLLKQLERYSACKEINTIIVVSNRGLDLPSKVYDNTLISFSLNKLWGLSV